MNPLELFFFSFLGIFVGSFLFLVIQRLPKNEQFLVGRSKCDFCNHNLDWFDLFPVLSYILTKGKCRYCHNRLSFLYPAFELFTAAVFALTYYLFPATSIVSLTFYLIIVSALLVIFFIDLFHEIIPFVILLPVTVIVVIYNFWFTPVLFLNYLFAALGAAVFFLVLFLVTRGKGLGFGDVVFAFFMGSLLGFPRIIIGLYISFVLGAVIGLIYIFIKKKQLRGSAIPFGPFLVLGTYIALSLPMHFIYLIFYYTHLNYLLGML